jgi:hypothetical protein
VVDARVAQVQERGEAALAVSMERINAQSAAAEAALAALAGKVDTMRIAVSGTEKAIVDLQRVHFYNAKMEELQLHFSETLVYIEQFRARVCRFVHGTFQASAIADGAFSQAAVRSPRKEPPKVAHERPFEIQRVDDDEEIGLIIRRALSTHANVRLVIPPGKRVRWNRNVRVKPYQAVAIVGSENSVIQMVGVEQVGSTPDPSRLVADGLARFELASLRIEARCGDTFETERVDLRALFIVRGTNALGPTVANFNAVLADTDRPLVNIGANGNAHMAFANCQIRNPTQDHTFCAITAESGAFPHGLATMIGSLSLSGNGIKSPESLYIVNAQESDE